MTILGVVIGILIGSLFTGLIIWIVGKLGLGLEVDGFGPAYLGAIVIAAISWVVSALLGPNLLGPSGLLGGLVHLIVAAIVLMVVGDMVGGLRVKGFGGALAAAVVIGIVGWLLGLGASSLVF